MFWLLVQGVTGVPRYLALGRTSTQIHTPTVLQEGWGGGWMEALPGVFDLLQYFETILRLVESLRSWHECMTNRGSNGM